MAKSTAVCAAGPGGVTRCGVTLCLVKPLCSFPFISSGWASQCSPNLWHEGPEAAKLSWKVSCWFSTQSPGVTACFGAGWWGQQQLLYLCCTDAWAVRKSAPQLLQYCKESCHLFLSDTLSVNTVPVYIQGSSLARKNLSVLLYFTLNQFMNLLWLLATTLLMLWWFKGASKSRFIEDMIEGSVYLKKAWLNYPRFFFSCLQL